MNRIRSFEDLEVWALGRTIRKELYRLANRLPKQEEYNLAQQIRTASVSLTANIAEGYGRFHFKENVQFCRIARGSAYELQDHLVTCRDLGYLDEGGHAHLHALLVRFARLLNGYIRSIGKSLLSTGSGDTTAVPSRMTTDA